MADVIQFFDHLPFRGAAIMCSVWPDIWLVNYDTVVGLIKKTSTFKNMIILNLKVIKHSKE